VGESARLGLQIDDVGIPRLQPAGKGALERAHDQDYRSTTREARQRRAGDAIAAAVIEVEECVAKSIGNTRPKWAGKALGRHR